jgi:hypothetical protein
MIGHLLLLLTPDPPHRSGMWRVDSGEYDYRRLLYVRFPFGWRE